MLQIRVSTPSGRARSLRTVSPSRPDDTIVASPPVELYPLVRLLLVVLNAVKNVVDAPDSVRPPVPLDSGILPPPGKSATDVEWRLGAPLGLRWCGLCNLTEIQRDRLKGSIFVFGSNHHIDDALNLLHLICSRVQCP